MKEIILTILVLGLWGTVGAQRLPIDSVLVCDTVDVSTDITIGKSRGNFDILCWYEYKIVMPSPCCCTVFVADTVYLPSDSLFKMKWDALHVLFDSVFKEIK